MNASSAGPQVKGWAQATWWLQAACALALGAAASLPAQKPQSAPATDSSAQASPIQPTPAAKPVDSSALASPEIGPSVHGGAALPPGAAVRVTLGRAIDSGRLKNGDSVPARLSEPVRTTRGSVLPAGTPVVITVVATVPAGKLSAVGEFSLQAVRVGSVATATDTQTYRGRPGHKDVADAAPALGTDAGLAAGAALAFHVLKPPTPASGAPSQTARVPGAVNGTASGGAPPKGAAGNSGEPVFGGANQIRTQNGQGAPGQPNQAGGTKPVGRTGSGSPGKASPSPQNAAPTGSEPADKSFEPAQHTGEGSSAPIQPAPPQSGTQGSTTQPR